MGAPAERGTVAPSGSEAKGPSYVLRCKAQRPRAEGCVVLLHGPGQHTARPVCHGEDTSGGDAPANCGCGQHMGW